MSKYILNFPLRAPPFLCVLRGNVPSLNDARRYGRKRVKNGGLRFRTETQRGPENTEELFLAAEGLIEFVSDCRLARLRTEQRARRGTASQFPAQRGCPEEGRQCNGEALACASGKRLFCSRKAIVKRTKKEWYQRHDGGKRNAIGIQLERRI